MANKKFGDTLRTLRKVKGYTQQQAADLLGLKNKSTLGSWEVIRCSSSVRFMMCRIFTPPSEKFPRANAPPIA